MTRPAGQHRAFVGRGEPLALLRSCLEDAAAGRSWLIWIEGGAGAGKTAFVRRVVEGLPDAVPVLRIEAEELARDVPFAALAAVGENGRGGPFATGLRLLERFGRSAATGPTVVVVEDLHWADTVSNQALLTAARRMGDAGVVMVITTRPGQVMDEGWGRLAADDDRCRRIELGPLDVTEITELAGAVGIHLTRRGAQRLGEHTRGHALYLRMVLDEMRARAVTDPDLDLPVPRSLASTTLARLAGVPPEAQALARALAVLNRRVPLAWAAHVAELPEAAPALDHLLAIDLATWSPSEPATPVELAHPLHRIAVYEDLAPTYRQALHRRAAEVIEPTAALAHRVAATTGFDDALAHELVTAAHQERQAGAPAAASRLLEWAATVDSRRSAADQHQLEAARLLLVDGQTARVAAQRGRLESCPPSPTRSLVLGMLAWQQGDAASAIPWLQQVRVQAGEGDDEVSGAALGLLGRVHSSQGHAAEAAAAGAEVVAIGVRDPAVERDGWTSLVLGEAWLRGPRSALTRLAGRLPDDVAAVDPADVDLLVIRGMLRYQAGETARPIDDLRAAVRLSRDHPRIRAHLHLAQALLQAGQTEEALAQGRVARSLAIDEGDVWLPTQIDATIAVVLMTRGETATAAEHLQRATHAAETVATPAALLTARIAMAMCAYARFQPAEVVDALLPLAREVPDQSPFVPIGWWPLLVIALLDGHRTDEADEQVDAYAAAAARRGHDVSGTVAELRARIDLARGRVAHALAGYAAAVEATTTERPHLERAQLHHGYGEALLAHGDRKRALDQLRTAHDLMARMEAEPFRVRVEATLRACGIPTGRTADRHRLALTGRERDVASLVATGMTNREVAAALYVSDKAVEYHLRNIFDKLGIRSRRELRNRDVAMAS